MSEFWIGVLMLPVLAVACVAAWTTVRGLLWLAGLVPVSVAKMTREMPPRQRALFAATAYASRKGRFFAFGDFGFAFFVGQDVSERAAAYDRVVEKVTYQALAKPHRRTPAPTGAGESGEGGEG